MINKNRYPNIAEDKPVIRIVSYFTELQYFQIY